MCDDLFCEHYIDSCALDSFLHDDEFDFLLEEIERELNEGKVLLHAWKCPECDFAAPFWHLVTIHIAASMRHKARMDCTYPVRILPYYPDRSKPNAPGDGSLDRFLILSHKPV